MKNDRDPGVKDPSKADGNSNAGGEGRPVKLGVRYDDLMARYANQVALRTTPEEVYLEFSSGVIPDPATGLPILPIHTRIAMTHAGARRLAEVLTQTLARTPAGEGQMTSGFPPLEK